jgi:sec-independent protein translocase protein TatC
MGQRDLTLTGHLEELRRRIIICLIFIAIGGLCLFPLSSAILNILKYPAKGLVDKLVFFSPQEGFMIYFKIAVVGGFVISIPVILYQVWAFFSPALEDRFKKYSLIFVFFSFMAFVCGCLFAYLFLLPVALRFLLKFGKGELEPLISAGKYISFVLAIVLCTGLVFEMPIISFILSKLGIINHRFLRKRFKYAILVIFVIAAIITPTPDVFNMTLLAIPMLLLYEISIWISFLAGPKGGVIR